MRSCRSSALPDEAEVDVAVEQHLLHRGAVTAEERAAAGGILPGEARHVARQKALRRHGGGAERQLERAVDRDVEQQSAASAEDVLRVAVDALALKRERQPPLGLAVEELEMQQLLQRADVVAHRGLGKVELFRGGGEAAGVHDGGKGSQADGDSDVPSHGLLLWLSKCYCRERGVVCQMLSRKIRRFPSEKTMKNAGRPEKAVFKPCAVCYDGRETTDGRCAHDLS